MRSNLIGNIDPRQMQELPINGQNWMALTLLTPGSRLNAIFETPVPADGASGGFQINVDGQQVTQTLGYGFGQPRYSREAIAEVELSGRFDASQGRASGAQLNAITKSGSNVLSGVVSGFMRDDRLNAPDPVVGIVLPYSNQQFGLSAGGPIRVDRIHVYGSYEYEREPQTFVYTTPYTSFNQSLSSTRREDKALARLDAQLSPQTRLTARVSRYVNHLPYDPANAGGSTRTPSSAIGVDLSADSALVAVTHLFGTRTLNEIRVGHDFFQRNAYAHVNNPNTLPGMTPGKGATQIILRGVTIGQIAPAPVEQLHDGWSVRDDLFIAFAKGGRHDVRLGGEYLFQLHAATNCVACNGTLDATGGPAPGNLESLFPDIMDVSTWNLLPLSPLSRTYQQSIVADVSFLSRPSGGSGFREYAPRHVYAAWVQDDWAMTPRLTLNLGLRYDLALGMYANWAAFPPFLGAERPNDVNNLAPRTGFAFGLTDRTVIRGGYGLYFGEISGGPAIGTIRFGQRVQPQVLYDGRADFATNPFKGPAPPYEEAARLQCSVTPGPQCLRPNLTGQLDPEAVVSYAHQASMGVQRLLSNNMTLEVDYAYLGDRSVWTPRNINLAFDPTTGANYPFTMIAKRPYPDWGIVTANRPDGRSNYHTLQTTLIRRMSNRWQASATYALDGFWIFDTLPLNPGCEYPVTLTAAGQPVCDVPITLAPDISQNEYYLSGVQRHRATANGIWQIGHGFQLSGAYLFGDQGKATPTSGVDVRQTLGGPGRLRPDGTLIERNSFDIPSIHRLDLRLQRRFTFGRVGIDGILDVFNVSNRANYGPIVLNESNSNYGKPSATTNVAYAPRMLQLGFRATF